MVSTELRRFRYSAVLLTLVAAACVDSPISPAPVGDVLRVDGTAVTNKPPIDQTLEGEAWVCKDGSGPATNFNFSVSLNGGAATTHSIALGTCVQVASVATGFFNLNTISVTEGALPANWALTSISIESNANAAAHQPVINPPNASARISHDFGAVFTFTNTFTPPPSLGCTRTQGYWKNHEEDWDAVADGKPFLTTSTFYNSGTSYITIMKTPPKGGNAYLQLAHQFIAASLNVNGGSSGVAGVDAALAGAAAYFAGAPAGIPNPTGATRTQLQAWATTLDNFNNGVTGPGHCPS
ncbi:MAG: hypothetical protein ACT4P6_09780 [Gemmatimonadaceae bacterium]